MTDIKEIPVDPPEPTVEKEMEIENNTDNIENNTDNITNISEPETPVAKKKINKNDQTQEPETPAHPKKGRGRPKGAPNKPKPKQKIPQDEPEIEPEPRRRAPQIINEEYWSPPPVDPTIQLLGILKNSLDKRQELKRQKYANWVGRF